MVNNLELTLNTKTSTAIVKIKKSALELITYHEIYIGGYILNQYWGQDSNDGISRYLEVTFLINGNYDQHITDLRFYVNSLNALFDSLEKSNKGNREVITF